MTALNYATQYSQALAQAYPHVLHFADLRSTENDSRYKWTGAKTIQVPTIATKGRVDGDRDSISVATRNYENSYESKTLSNHRKWTTLVHPMDIDETNYAATIQTITQAFNEQQKFPEMDAYLISKLFADWTAVGETADTTAITEDNILRIVDGYTTQMKEKNVPLNGLILYATPTVEATLLNAKEIKRYVQNRDTIISRAISFLEETKIESVPSDLMKTVYDFTEGWKVGTGAKQINIALAHPSAVITPEKYAFAQLDPPSAGSEGKYIYFEESYDDVFILNERKSAIMFNVEA